MKILWKAAIFGHPAAVIRVGGNLFFYGDTAIERTITQKAAELGSICALKSMKMDPNLYRRATENLALKGDREAASYMTWYRNHYSGISADKNDFCSATDSFWIIRAPG